MYPSDPSGDTKNEAPTLKKESTLLLQTIQITTLRTSPDQEMVSISLWALTLAEIP